MTWRGLGFRVLLGLALAAFYLWSVPLHSDAQLLGNDAFAYAAALASGELARLLNPHHLLHHLMAFGVLNGQVLISGGSEATLADGLGALRIVSALGGAACAVLVGHFARRLAGRAAGWWLGAAFAFSAGPWLYSAVGETYLPAAAIGAWLFGELLIARREQRAPSTGRIVALLTLACMLRQDSVLLVPGVLLLAGPRQGPLAVGIAGGVSLGLYAIAYGLASTSAGLGEWLRGLAETGLWGEGFTPERAWVTVVTQQHALHYGVRFGGGWAVLSLTGTALLVGAAFAAGGNWRQPGIRIGLAALALTISIRLLFFTWWQPSNMEYHTPTLVPGFLMLALIAGRSNSPARSAMQSTAGRIGPVTSAGLGAAAALSLLLGNGACLFEPLRTTTGSNQARAALDQAGQDGLVLVLDPFSGFAVDLAAEPGRRVANAARTGAELDRDALFGAMSSTLASGAPVAMLRDVSLMPRLALPLYPIDEELLAKLAGLQLETERFESNGEPWMMVLRSQP